MEELRSAYRELEVARSKYEKGLIRERIRKIESTLGPNPMKRTSSTKIVNEVVEIEETQTTSEKVYEVSKIEDKCIEIEEQYDTAHISDITRCRISISTDHSVYIKGAKHSTFFITAQQIRVHSSTSIVIHAYTATGVYIEDSSDVKVVEHTPSKQPPYKNNIQVYDFNRESTI